MLFWVLVSVLTAAVAVALLLPLMRAEVRTDIPQSHDVEVYRDQLAELQRDTASGLISGDEAEFARAEVARRLLAANEAVKAAAPVSARRANRIAQMAVIVFLPLAGLCLYLATGRPDLPDAPLAMRLANPGEDINILVAKAEQHLVQNPEDGAGWDILAPIYYREGRMEDAGVAYQNAIRILGPTPARLGGYAESLIALSGGLVTTEAQDALQQSLALEPSDPRSEYYLALALKQQGKTEEARSAFEALVRASPKDAPWLPLVNTHLAELKGGAVPGGKAPGNPTEADVAAAQTMDSGDRTAMIEGMVASLAEKLKQDPKNFEGWMRIVRSYAVLDRKAEAGEALRQGLQAFPAETEQGRGLLALASELGINAGKDVK
ncbi:MULTISPECIES: c-type cytochrome biogenesis protein CcmI [unclassified Rhizobium]|uniref:c-type cytochrome biogenesis protein CcmI n=1 Tax=unclassified Rhizobium TaxID=2613769 RepID=UPI0006FAC495|nr:MULTISPECIES: c-type cytochrome biogenesis protein CcmI [unclassified Rhizobium]KQV43505.1 cytochrome C biogenesis protein CycH [Rhizobium sp. Root1212]KRD37690.1 cytochrome C biogenesis protein CycH [Rhizobium sp. Root268]